MALGAQAVGLMRLVLVHVRWLAGISIVVSLPISLLLARLLRSQLFGVSPSDPLTLLLGTLLVCAAGCAGSADTGAPSGIGGSDEGAADGVGARG
jgi:hypothetical protein